MKILILGGTEEARMLAGKLAGMGHEVVSSLAGRTRDPILPDGGTVRSGGFGGVDGLAAYLKVEAFDRMIDATHPYAAEMSWHAAEASERTGIPIVRFTRKPWPEPHYAFWRHVPDTEAAATVLPSGARAFLTIGSTGLEPFYRRTDCTFLIRSIETPDRLPPNCWSIRSRPPYIVPSETELMKAERITHLVTKNSGGQQTEAKLKAATNAGATTIMIDRPALPAVPEAPTFGSCIVMLKLEMPHG
jgi:precorrin-6A/cobalt-precorrin-6A reductase